MTTKEDLIDRYEKLLAAVIHNQIAGYEFESVRSPEFREMLDQFEDETREDSILYDGPNGINAVRARLQREEDERKKPFVSAGTRILREQMTPRPKLGKGE